MGSRSYLDVDEEMTKRLSQDDRLWKLAFDIAEYSTCDRAKHGCVIAREGLVLATGYNGALEGEPHCDEAGHQLVRIIPYDEWAASLLNTYEDHCIRAVHAEQNAITNAAIVGVSIKNAVWYITGVPCVTCSKMMLRTNPNGILMCSDRGAASGEANEQQVKWWKEYCSWRITLVLNLISTEELKIRGVI